MFRSYGIGTRSGFFGAGVHFAGTCSKRWRRVPAVWCGRDAGIQAGLMNASVAPPFRAEHIGSLLRPAALAEARRRHAAGEIDDDALHATENHAIVDAIALQARVGLRLATAGESLRPPRQGCSGRQLGDMPPDAGGGGAPHAGGRGAQPTAVIRSKVKWTKPIHADEFELLNAHTGATPKITIPGPCAVHFRGGDAAVLAHAYDDMDEFWDDIVAAFRPELVALGQAVFP